MDIVVCFVLVFFVGLFMAVVITLVSICCNAGKIQKDDTRKEPVQGYLEPVKAAYLQFAHVHDDLHGSAKQELERSRGQLITGLRERDALKRLLMETRAKSARSGAESLHVASYNYVEKTLAAFRTAEIAAAHELELVYGKDWRLRSFPECSNVKERVQYQIHFNELLRVTSLTRAGASLFVNLRQKFPDVDYRDVSKSDYKKLWRACEVNTKSKCALACEYTMHVGLADSKTYGIAVDWPARCWFEPSGLPFTEFIF
jgi:hypothetical protein